MKGYVLHKSTVWTHAMKRAIGPGTKISLHELYEQYGKKHDLPEGEEFVNWLRNVKLRDTERWKIVLDGDVPTGELDKSGEKKDEKETSKTTTGSNDNVPPIVVKEMDVSDVVGLSVRKGREIIPHIMDLNLLKYALQEANQLAGKDSLCQVIRKRIQGIEIAR